MGRRRLPENKINGQLLQDAIDANSLGISYGYYVAGVISGKYKRTDYIAKCLAQKKERRQDEDREEASKSCKNSDKKEES